MGFNGIENIRSDVQCSEKERQQTDVVLGEEDKKITGPQHAKNKNQPQVPDYQYNYTRGDASSYRRHSLLPERKDDTEFWRAYDARPILPWVAFFMGDLRDGLPMLNMQSSFLMISKQFQPKLSGILLFAFGLSLVFCLAPVGYYFDYSNKKIRVLMFACIGISALTVLIPVIVKPEGENITVIIIVRIIQGALSSFQPPGINGITLGIVGSTGFTRQVSRNKMMNHIGTVLVVFVASILAYYLYPTIGPIFIVSPLACFGLCYFLCKIKPEHIDKDAARNLITKSPTMTSYEEMDETNEVLLKTFSGMGPEDADRKDCATQSNKLSNSCFNNDDFCWSLRNIFCCSTPPISVGSYTQSETGEKCLPPENLFYEVDACSSSANKESMSNDLKMLGIPVVAYTPSAKNVDDCTQQTCKSKNSEVPSFNFIRHNDTSDSQVLGLQARTPYAVLMDKNLILFSVIVFFFHMSNSSILPLVMQLVAVDDPQEGILLSAMCILIAQSFMVIFAKICGDYSPIWGRKKLFLLGLFSLPVRCFLLSFLITLNTESEGFVGPIFKALVVGTQLLDSVGAGIFGTLYILVTNDISGGTGRFSLMLGTTTGAMCLGGTISSYVGNTMAQDYGHQAAIEFLGLVSLFPAFLYLFFMPETLPEYARPQPKKKRLQALLMRINRHSSSLWRKSFPGLTPKSDDLGGASTLRHNIRNDKDAAIWV